MFIFRPISMFNVTYFLIFLDVHYLYLKKLCQQYEPFVFYHYPRMGKKDNILAAYFSGTLFCMIVM